jgi:hypothetical protein
MSLNNMDFIQGEKFRVISDNNKIFYCDTHNVNNFFESINFDHNFILISHNSDGKVTKTPKHSDADFNKKPKNLKKWFAQNVCVDDEVMVSLPIGLENSEWFPSVKKLEKIKNKKSEPKNFKNLLYINHNILTNPTERQKPYEIFNGKNWVTLEYGNNGVNFDGYLKNIYSHKFVLCPEGNGTDTHRTWECLYLGIIPIEKRNINNSFYEDLPICFVDKWEEINEDFLNKEYERINSNNFNTEKLNFLYWSEKINEYVRYIN